MNHNFIIHNILLTRRAYCDTKINNRNKSGSLNLVLNIKITPTKNSKSHNLVKLEFVDEKFYRGRIYWRRWEFPI